MTESQEVLRMEMQTLADVLAWANHLQSLGAKHGPYPAQELGQALQILAQADAETRQMLAAWKADQARLDAALAAGDDLDVFQAGVRKGLPPRLGACPAGGRGGGAAGISPRPAVS